MTRPAPIERTTRLATTVDNLPAAWAFIMDRIDEVGPDPTVTIKPLWIMSVGEMQDGLEGREVAKPPREFEVVVSGMVEEEDPT